MRHARPFDVRRIARLAAVAGMICGGLMVTDAMAGESTSTAPQPDAGATRLQDPAALGTSLVSKLGPESTAGTWIGKDGRAVVAVTDAAAAAEVRRAGAEPRMVRYSMNRLKAACDALRAAPRVAGTAWAIDPATNQVVVLADSSVSKADWTRMTGTASRIGGEVRMQRTQGTITTRIGGADPVFSQDARCSVGFNVTNGTNDFFLTAGHCGPPGTRWFGDARGGTFIGTTLDSDFPGHDFSIVGYQNSAVSRQNAVDIGGGRMVTITGIADPVVGQEVFRSGSTTGLHSGSVTALNATVNYPEGTVSGLIETTVCAEPGDSGGPLFANGIALGLTSGGSGDCTAGGVTFFQPLTPVLSSLGVNLPGVPTQTGGVPTTGAAQGNAAAPAVNGSAGGSTGLGAGLNLLSSGTALDRGIAVVTASSFGLIATRWIRPGNGRRRGARRPHPDDAWR